MATTSKPATARKPNAAFMKPLTPSAELAAVIGSEAVPRTEVTKKIWEYIKKHNLQDASNKRNINADAKQMCIRDRCAAALLRGEQQSPLQPEKQTVLRHNPL